MDRNGEIEALSISATIIGLNTSRHERAISFVCEPHTAERTGTCSAWISSSVMLKFVLSKDKKSVRKFSALMYEKIHFLMKSVNHLI